MMKYVRDDMEPILIANALMLFFAGFDTQAITIALMMHNMVRNEDIQVMLMIRIRISLKDDDDYDHDPGQTHRGGGRGSRG